MNKQDFLGRLRSALNGRLPAPQVEDTINYYEDYINVEMRKGKSEEEVLDSLGDPRLIARTIVQTNGTPDDEYDAPNEDYRESGHQGGYYGEQYQDAYEGYHTTRRSFHIPGWFLAILIVLVVFFVISIVFSVLSFLAPVIIVMAAVLFLAKLFRDWLN